MLNVLEEDISALESTRSESSQNNKDGVEEKEPRHYLRIVNNITEEGSEKGRIINKRKRRYLPLSLLQNIKQRLQTLSFRMIQLEKEQKLENQIILVLQLLDELFAVRVLWEAERMMVYSALRRLQQQIPRKSITWFDTQFFWEEN